LLGAFVLLVASAGCSTSSDPSGQVAAMNDSNIRRVANLYTAFQIRKGFAGPKDEAAFKQFIERDMSPKKLQLMQVDPAQVDNLFTSERDGKPFTVRYGVQGGIGVVAAVVFEQQGKDGKRQVGFTGGTVEEVDDARYGQLLKGTRSEADVGSRASG
jgi:hypothetical protein